MSVVDYDKSEGVFILKTPSCSIKFTIGACYYHDVLFPSFYIPLLISESSEEAKRLLLAVIDLTNINLVMEKVLKTACEKGFAEAWALVNRYRANAPQGYSFYADPESREIDFVNGRKGYTFYADGFDPGSLGLPENVYVETRNMTYITLHGYMKAVKCREKFWKFLERLEKLYAYISERKMKQLIATFLSPDSDGEAKAYVLLREEEKNLERALRKEKIIREFKEKGVAGINGGYLVMIDPDYYYPSLFIVSDIGEVKEIDYKHDRSTLNNIIYKLICGKSVKIEFKEASSDDIKNVVTVLGKVRPDLALVMA